MRIPAIPEKIRVPRLPAGYLARSRLDHAWQTWNAKSLVLVAAGAGSGKTSFLAANAVGGGRPCVWLSLDSADADLVVFTTHLLAALETDAKDGGDLDDSEYARFALVQALNTVRAKPGLALILDDAHCVRGAASVLTFLTELVRYFPATSTLIISSREPLSIATLKTRCHGSLATVSARDLEFRPDEAAELFARRFPGAVLTFAQSRRLVAQTEGWAAGIEIFLQLLDGSRPEAVERALDRMKHSSSGWFDYFAEEVVRHLDEPTQDFLARSAVMPILRTDLCNALLRRDDSRDILTKLTQRNLFTVTIDPEKGTFRYHHLFRAFLRDRLTRVLESAAYAAHLRSAAHLLARHEMWAEAAESYAEAGDIDAALDVIEHAGEALLATGQYGTVRRALDSLPARRLSERPAIAFIRARLFDLQHDWRQAEKHYRKALKKNRDPRRRAELMGLVAQILSRTGRMKAAVAWCRRAESENARVKPAVRGRTLATVGVCYAELGRLDEGERSLRDARGLYRRSRDIAGQARIDYLLAINIYLRRGEFKRAYDTARDALTVFRRLGNARRTCYSLAVVAHICAEMGVFCEAGELAEETLRLAEFLGQPQQTGLAHLILGRCMRAAGDYEGAQRNLELAKKFGEQLDERDLRALSRLEIAECHRLRGNLPAARIAAREAFGIMRAAHDPIQQARCAVVLGALAVDDNRKTARRWWREAEILLRRSGAHFDLARLLLMRIDAGVIAPARMKQSLGILLEDDPRVDLDVLFRIADPNRAAHVLAEALRHDVAVERAMRILSKLGDSAVPVLGPLVQDPDETVRLRAVAALTRIGGQQARTILGRVARRAARVASPPASMQLAADEIARAPEHPLRVEALGALRLRIGDRPCPPKSWRSSRALRLFQLLLGERFRWVSKDVLIETLWPGVDPPKGADNLWQSVHRLRRVLEPDLGDLRDSRYVQFQNDAYRLVPGDGYFYDVEAFERAVRDGRALAAENRLRVAERRLREALDLYCGEYFAESPYEEFLTIERESLRDQYLGALLSLIDLYARARRWAECLPLAQRGLVGDPFDESFHEKLIAAHLMLGHRREALDNYHAYEEMVLRELRMQPSARMKELAAQITTLSGRMSEPKPPVFRPDGLQ